MLQAENDYDPELVARLAEPVLSGQADLVLDSRDLSDPELARTCRPGSGWATGRCRHSRTTRSGRG